MPAEEDPAILALRQRLDALSETGRALEAEGLPFPTEQIRSAFEQALDENASGQALAVVKRGEALLARVGPDWTWVRELLRRADDLRATAQKIGVDVEHLDTRVGNPRRRLMSEPLSAGSLEKAAASASLALAVLNDAIPKFCLQEAQQLGVSIRRARDRGEEVSEATGAFSRLLQAIQDGNLATAVERLLEVRRSVVRIPRAPALPAASPSEEEEILLEARNLARRLQRIKGKAQNAQSAARLMAQVRAAISDERRYGTPEEEIEALWAEVDRLTRERKRASEGPPLAPLPEGEAEPELEPETGFPGEPEPGGEPEDLLAEEPPAESAAEPPNPAERDEPKEEAPEERAYRQSLYVPYVPLDLLGTTDEDANGPSGARARSRTRPRP